MTIKKPASSPFVFTPQHQEIIEAAFFPYHLLIAPQVTMLLRPTLQLGNLTKMQEQLKLDFVHFSDQGLTACTSRVKSALAFFRHQGKQPMSEKSVHPSNAYVGQRACR